MSLIGFIPLDPRRSRANPPLLMITLLFKLNYSDEPDVYLKPLHRGSGPAQGHSGLLDLLSVLTLSTPWVRLWKNGSMVQIKTFVHHG